MDMPVGGLLKCAELLLVWPDPADRSWLESRAAWLQLLDWFRADLRALSADLRAGPPR